jgi:glycosyltransferase involved in cell wall biosynthesis
MGFYLNDWRRFSDLNRLERVYRATAEAIDAASYDAVLVNACRFLQAPSLLAHLTTPNVYYCHEPPRRFLQRACREDAGPLTAYQRLRSLWHRPATKLLDSVIARRDRRNFSAADAVLTNSRFTAAVIEKYYDSPAQVCRLGVDTDRFRPSTGNRRDYVVSVGALEPHKGFDFVVRSLALLPEVGRPELVIVANYLNPGVATDLHRLARAHGVAMRVMEAVTEDELVALYQGARAFVYAPHEEPFGLAVLEAMACGIPVVAVAEGGVVESVMAGASGLLTDRKESLFAEALSRVLSDGELAMAMGNEGRRLAKTDWSWQAAGRRLEAHLEEVVSGHQRTGLKPLLSAGAVRQPTQRADRR